MLNKNHTGLIVGFFMAILHAIWTILIGIMSATLQNGLDWIFNIHMMQPYLIITSFSLSKAIILVIVTFIIGYIFGWIFALVWNWIKKK